MSSSTHQQQPSHHHHQHAEECPSCMEELDGVKNFAKTNCGHSFCLSCLVKSLKNNNTCPMCRTNIEETKPENTNMITLEDCVDLIKEEMEIFPYREHLDAITMFDNPVSTLKSMLRVFGLGLSKSIIAYQTEEMEEEIYDDEEEEDAENDDDSGDEEENVTVSDVDN